MQDWIIGVVATYGYLGVFLMIALENVFPPIPSEVILTFGGFMTAVTRMNVPGVVSAATAGSLAGAMALYCMGRVLGKSRIDALVKRRGHLIRVQQRDVDRAMGWFDRYKGKTVFFCRMVPLVRSLISIPAGMACMPLGGFLSLTALGSLVWNTVLVGAGAVLGERWDSILGFLDLYSTGVATVLAIGVVAGALFLLLRRRAD